MQLLTVSAVLVEDANTLHSSEDTAATTDVATANATAYYSVYTVDINSKRLLLQSQLCDTHKAVAKVNAMHVYSMKQHSCTTHCLLVTCVTGC
jgi:hypothetical protein